MVFLSLCSSVLHEAYIVIVYIMYFFLGIFYFSNCHCVPNLYLMSVHLYGLNRFYIISSNLMDLFWCTAMFFLTILYKDRAQTVAE